MGTRAHIASGVRVAARAAIAAAVALLALAAWTGAAHAQEDEGEQEISHEAEECIHILEDGGDVDDCQEAPNLILPAADELIWGGLSFAVLMVALGKFAYPAVQRGMNNRTERIRSSLDEAERTRAEAQQVLEEYQRQLADARNEAARIIEDARQTADGLRRDLETKAQAEIAEARRRMNEQLAGERERVMAEISDQVKVIAIELAEKVVESSLDREANMRLIDNYIDQVGNGARAT